MAELEHITSFEADSVAFLNTGEVFSTKFDTYYIELEQAGSSTYNEIYLTDSSNARLNANPGDAHYDNAMRVLKSTGTPVANKDDDLYVGWREIGVYINNQDTGYGMSMYLFNPYDSSKYTFLISQSVGMVGTAAWTGKAIGSFKSAEQHNGLYVANSGGGTMDYIKLSVYGVIKP